VTSYLRGLDPGLPRAVWILQTGGLANSFGNGLFLPFLVIYLHNVRGIPVGIAASVAAANSVAGFLSAFAAGTLSDRIGPRRVVIGALCVMTVAIGLFPLVHQAWQAFALYSLSGLGSGSFWPAQSTLLTGLTPPARRHSAFATQRLTMNLGVALGGLTGGLIASTAHPRTFTILFLLDAATFLAYVAVLARLPSPALAVDRMEGSYAQVVRDRVFLAYTSINALFIAASIAVWVELLPPFAKNQAHVSEKGVGILWAVDSLVVVIAQLPIAKLAEGRRRMRGLALMGLVWALAMVGFGAIGYWTRGWTAAVLMAAVTVVFAAGECLHGTIQAPLSADLAPPRLVGRYLAFSSQSWQIGWIVGPAGGGFILQHAPFALWPAAAGVNLAGAAASLALERKQPRELRRTPRVEVEPRFAAGQAG
jgi:MFS family permease